MATWTCPDCNRSFGAVGRNHTCLPGRSLDEFLAGSPSFVGPVVRVVCDHLETVDAEIGGDLIIDPLAKQVQFKNGPTFCVLQVKTKWVAVGFSLRRALETGRLSRKTSDYGDKHYHVINVADPDLIDQEFREWLTEAYLHGATTKRVASTPVGVDPMVPDDIEFEIAPPRST